MKHIKKQDNVLILDTTLRDGEQSPGATMSHAETVSYTHLTLPTKRIV